MVCYAEFNNAIFFPKQHNHVSTKTDSCHQWPKKQLAKTSVVGNKLSLKRGYK